MPRILFTILLFFCLSVSNGQKIGAYYDLRTAGAFNWVNPIAGLHVTDSHIFLLKWHGYPEEYFELVSISKQSMETKSVKTQMADTPLTGFFNLDQYLYGANDEVLLFYQQLSPDDNTLYASAIERYNSELERTLIWRGPTLKFSTVDVGPDGMITAIGLHKYGALTRTIRVNSRGQQVMDSTSRVIRTAWGLHCVEDSFYCFVDGNSIAHMDDLGIVQDIETTEIQNAGETYLPSTVSLLTSDTALVVSYFADYEEHKDDGDGLAKIDLEGRVLWNWTPLNQEGRARDATAMPNGRVAVAMAGPDLLRIVEKDGTISIRKHYQLSKQKKGNLGFRKIQYDPNDSSLWVAVSTSEEFEGDTNSYKGVAILHLDMEGNLLDTTQNIEVTNVSIPEVQRPTRVACYPNPAQSQLKLELPAGEAAYTYRIINLMGKLYLQGTLQNGQAVEIESLPTGLFLIEVQNEEGFFFSSFIKE